MLAPIPPVRCAFGAFGTIGTQGRFSGPPRVPPPLSSATVDATRGPVPVMTDRRPTMRAGNLQMDYGWRF